MTDLAPLDGHAWPPASPPGSMSRDAHVLAGINRILQEALRASTEEELGRLCLEVAEDLTGAAFSFFGERRTSHDRLDHIAISERGWRSYTGDDPDFSQRQLPNGMKIHGIFGQVILQDRSLIVNDPTSHPSRVGLPDGHPALHNFLGVPLRRDGETFAMFALGNHPTGFTERERAIAEELAPAIVQALLRKRAEVASRASQRRLLTLIGGIPQLVWTATRDGQWTWASPQWVAMTGLSVEESLGHGWLVAVHPDDREAARRFWAEASDRGDLAMEGRLRQGQIGRYRWFKTRATPVHDDHGAIVEWFGTSTDIDDLRRLRERQETLVAELQHRVRNILTIVRSIFTRTVESGGPIDEISDHFRGRLDSLARTQVVATQTRSGRVDLENLIRDELLGVGAIEDERLSIGGPDVALAADTAESVGLAIHELTTNALKYGALRHAGGRLSITWKIEPKSDCKCELIVKWDETGVPAMPVPPVRQGFGTELIREALPYGLGARTSLEFRGGGVLCVMSLPLPGDDAGLSNRSAEG
ncbi:PAS domain S-box-containing protein [Sphingomonas sp. SORGH_AS 950]|uniref:sensor histidine kinase n=1 Tax=Sphingomonas sp. SORGH_AS_0950 TaxID=3041792 RepID=UPI002782CD57|nr:GAF domain-containing protein [Sphingomonas sp. SORGH_AS_0950]MDQ1157474.1 PAS domain S-box-containing protein [Sphingomonas sp. SORGH_AS_0950]